MSFLAPWFLIAGLVAVSLPILFHLFRRTPRGRMTFSTLMFLAPSPPRLTRRSRLENLPLLLLRALILTLLAIAFGRPFLRQLLEQTQAAPLGRRVVVLVDTSASMRRGDLWQQTVRRAGKEIDAASPHDELALIAFDAEPRTLVSLEAWRTAPVDQRAALARASLGEATPGWAATHLDRALLAAVEMLEGAEQAKKGAASSERSQRIVLISDAQSGSRLDRLRGTEWPKRIDVELAAAAVRSVNAGLHALTTTDEAQAANASSVRPRVLVSNAADSSRESFTLEWKSTTPEPETKEPIAKEPNSKEVVEQEAEPVRSLPIYVPPGQTRVIRAPLMPAGDSAELTLRGDDEPFDNSLWFVPPASEQLRVLHLASEPADDPQTLRYFLERALGQSASGRTIQVETVDPFAAETRAPTERDLQDVPLITLALERELPDAWRDVLAGWLERGGVALAVAHPGETSAWRTLLPAPLTDTANITVEPGDGTREYVLLANLDLRHPVLEPFADPRFSDFTKIRIWKHRRLKFAEPIAARFQILARFDNGDIALAETRRGAGRIVLLATGWQPRESQLGVSSKFVPLMTTLVELGWHRATVTSAFEAGETIDLARLGHVGAKDAPLATGPWTVKSPTGRESQVTAEAARFSPSDGPGVYEVRSSAGVQRLAVNLPADESKTAPLSVEALEAAGVRLVKESAEPLPEDATERLVLQSRELESRQQLWRWCLVAALIAIVLETSYAGWLAAQKP